MSSVTQLQTPQNVGELNIDSENVPTLLVQEIAPILSVANEVESMNPRVAYLCRFYALEKAHKLDPQSTGEGVRAFLTALMERLKRESRPSSVRRTKERDELEMLSCFEQHNEKYIQALQNSAADEAERAELTKMRQTANILFEVLQHMMEVLLLRGY